MLCKFKHIFGKERQGFHAIRVFDLAILDVIGTIMIGFLISKYLKVNIIAVITLLFATAMFVHRLFGVNTKLNTLIFGTMVCP